MRQTIHLILYVAVTILMAGCTGGSGTKRVPQASDTLYTEKAAMDVYGTQPEWALEIIDSAEMVGNLTEDRAIASEACGRHAQAYDYMSRYAALSQSLIDKAVGQGVNRAALF